MESKRNQCRNPTLQPKKPYAIPLGAEPIGLLRWNSIQYSRLVDALEESFSAFDKSENLFLVEAGREFVLRDRKYNTSMHTFSYVNEVQPGKLLAQQEKRTAFLKRKLLSDLELGEKIFVYLDSTNGHTDAGRRLLASVRKYSKATVLYVTPAARASDIGKVEDAGDGLLRGYIRKLGREADGSWNIAFGDWLEVCKAVKNILTKSIESEQIH